jgi:hypothetical protein
MMAHVELGHNVNIQHRDRSAGSHSMLHETPATTPGHAPSGYAAVSKPMTTDFEITEALRAGCRS